MGRRAIQRPPTSKASSPLPVAARRSTPFMLQTHYRSRHESLIAFSNHSFYRRDLHTFPSALTRRTTGSALSSSPPATCTSAAVRRTTRVEAEKVVERIVHHFDTRPGSSLGVVAFSQAQPPRSNGPRRARKTAPTFVTMSNPAATDSTGFFIKNLETVQGDERDVIIFSRRVRTRRTRQDHQQLRTAQPSRRLASTQRRGHPGPQPCRSCLVHPRSQISPRSPTRASGTFAATSTTPNAASPPSHSTTVRTTAPRNPHSKSPSSPLSKLGLRRDPKSAPRDTASTSAFATPTPRHVHARHRMRRLRLPLIQGRPRP